MQLKNFILILPFTALVACGGSEESEVHDSNDKPEAEYHTSFGTCEVTNNMISRTELSYDEAFSFSLGAIEGADFSSFTHSRAELTKDHGTLRIKFTNNAEILSKGISQYSGTDESFEISYSPDSESVNAGEFSSESSKITLLRGRKIDGVSKGQEVGSNKTIHHITINDISEKHLCGSYRLADNEGSELIEASFDLDINLSMF